jgi:hypothetical protein
LHSFSFPEEVGCRTGSWDTCRNTCRSGRVSRAIDSGSYWIWTAVLFTILKCGQKISVSVVKTSGQEVSNNVLCTTLCDYNKNITGNWYNCHDYFKAGSSLKLLTYILEVPRLNLEQDTYCSDWIFSWFCLVSLDKFWDSAITSATIASCHNFSNSLFADHSNIRLHIIWVNDSAVKQAINTLILLYRQ